MSKNLYQIQSDYLQLMSEIEQQEGLLEEEQITALEINKNELQGKSIAYLEIIKQKESFIMRIDDEIKRLQTLKKQNSTLVSILKDRLLNAVNLFGEFSVGTVTFKTRKSTSVEIEDEDAITKEFKNVKITTTIDKTKIKKTIQSGQAVEGARLSENLNLAIK